MSYNIVQSWEAKREAAWTALELEIADEFKLAMRRVGLPEEAVDGLVVAVDTDFIDPDGIEGGVGVTLIFPASIVKLSQDLADLLRKEIESTFGVPGIADAIDVEEFDEGTGPHFGLDFEIY